MSYDTTWEKFRKLRHISEQILYRRVRAGFCTRGTWREVLKRKEKVDHALFEIERKREERMFRLYKRPDGSVYLPTAMKDRIVRKLFYESRTLRERLEILMDADMWCAIHIKRREDKKRKKEDTMYKRAYRKRERKRLRAYRKQK
jgi:hypothetical protein